MTEDEDILRYDRMVEAALRGVVKSSIREVIKYGLPGDHHFYITFITTYEGVDIPEYLMERYPGEMTIVLQYQFSDLEVDDEFLKVTLSFNSVPERLIIPLNSISIFADPSVNFALQFQPMDDELSDEDLSMFEDDGPDDDGSGGGSGKGDKTGEVVSLDKFRKK